MTIETASMFTGVNVGYQGDKVTITDPSEAVKIVKEKLSDAGKTDYAVHPGVVIYHKGWGCPEGGEVVAAVLAHDEPAEAIQTGAFLREQLDQSTLSVGTYVGDEGAKTKGFIAVVPGDLRSVGAAWQDAAFEHGNFHPTQNYPQAIYVSCGMYDRGDGHVVIQAEANPEFIKDTAAWEKQVHAVAGDVSKKLGTEIKPEFRDAGFTYLQKPKEVTPPATQITEGGAEVRTDAAAKDASKQVS